MRKLLMLIWLWLPCGLAGQSFADTLTLGRVLEKAREQALEAYRADRDLAQASSRYAIYRADLRPQLSGSLNFPNFSRTSSAVTQPDGNIAFQPIANNFSFFGLSLEQNIPFTGGALFVRSNLERFDDFENDMQSYNGVPIRFGISQPLFGFNAMKWEQRIRPIDLKAAQRQYVATREAGQEQAVALFFDLLDAAQEMAIAQLNVDNNRQLLTMAKERHALGRLSQSDLLQLEVQLLNAQRSAKRAEQAAQLAQNALFLFLGEANPQQLLKPVPPIEPDSFPITIQEALNAARRYRPDLLQLERDQLEAEREIARTKGTGGLQANLTASFGYTRSATNIEGIYQDPQQEQFLQLQVGMPILDWGRQRERVAIAEAERDFVRQQSRRQTQAFQNDIQQAVVQLEDIREELQLTRQLQGLARDRYRIARESYVLGALSVTDLTIAQQERDQARRTYINTLRRCWQQVYRIRGLTLYDFSNDQPILYP